MVAKKLSPSIPSGEDGLGKYLKKIRSFPMLEPQEEYMLAKRWCEHGDVAAADKIVRSHLRLVAMMAAKHCQYYGRNLGEMISVGNEGLMKGIKHFRLNKGARFATCAAYWVRAEFTEYIMTSSSLVKTGTTAEKKRLFFNLRRVKKQIGVLGDGDMHPDQVKTIADRLRVSKKDVIDMNRRLGGDYSLNVPLRTNDDADEWQDWLVDDSPNQEELLAGREGDDERRYALFLALGMLDARERDIFESRKLSDDPKTLEALGDKWGISKERVRQIERRAFEKVQNATRAQITGEALPTPTKTLHLQVPAYA